MAFGLGKIFQRKKTAIPERDDRFMFAAPAIFDICRQMCPSIADKSASRKGLVSIDRSEAAALLSTTPRLRTRSSTNDFAPLRCMGWVSLRPGLPVPGRLRAVVAVALPPRAPNAVDPRVSLPPYAEALTVSSHVWAGF